MSVIEKGKLKIDPAINPAILNTGTWDFESIISRVKAIPEDFFNKIANQLNVSGNNTDLSYSSVTCFSGSIAPLQGAIYALLEFPDKQSAFIMLKKTETDEVLKESFYTMSFPSELNIMLYPTTSDNIYLYVNKVHYKKGPHPLGSIPRLGIGVRHTTTLWPGIWNAMYKGDFSANAIQNSVRELHLLETLTNGLPARKNHLFSFGTVEEGHTGSTFEGLWTEGVLSAIKRPYNVRYGADADHLQVKRGNESIERTKQFIDASRYYTFYTLDVSDILNYEALSAFSANNSIQYIEDLILNKNERNDIIWYHKQKKTLGKQYIEHDEAQIGRLVGKYWKALNAVEELYKYIESIKNGEKFDLELSIDENPPFIRTFDSITTYAELLFLVDEIERRGLPISHIAPNFGVEKGTDYRGDDGKAMFENRISILHKIASEKNIMLDCHSGDDLSRETRRIFNRATGGNIHFKISPSLQVLYAEVLSEIEPELFEFWWKDTLAYAENSAQNGSPFAKYSLSLLKRSSSETPSPHHLFFKELCFATLGKRDQEGHFVNREKFYDLSEEFYSEMKSRTEQKILEVADDLFNLA